VNPDTEVDLDSLSSGELDGLSSDDDDDSRGIRMKIDAGRFRRPLLGLGVLLAVWTTYWAAVIWTEVRTSTTLGQGEGIHEVAAHDVFQVLFVAAHGGVRWMAGVVALLLVGLAIFLRRRAAVKPARARPREKVSVAGD
jgi:hypothetical protein